MYCLSMGKTAEQLICGEGEIDHRPWPIAISSFLFYGLGYQGRLSDKLPTFAF
jgi:hypothetical protein